MKERLRSHLKELTSLISVSGEEMEVIRYMKEKLEPLADEVKVMNNGNLIAIKKGNKEGHRVMLSAHSDEVGLVVKAIMPNGFILFEKSGGLPDKALPGRKIHLRCQDKRINGIIGIRAAHMETPATSGTVQTTKESYIDVGATSKEEVEAMGITVGTRGVMQSDFMEMENTDFISTRAVDNRINCAIMIELFEYIKDKKFAGELYGVISVQEEVTIAGVTGAAHYINPDYAITLDTVPAGDVPDINLLTELPISLGKGPGLSIVEGVNKLFKYAAIHPKLKDFIMDKAREEGINVQPLVMSEFGYSTDSTALVNAGDGIPVATLSTPRRYTHSPVEMMNLNDAVGALTVLKKVILENEHVDLSFIS
ncbi:MAG: M42 family metallopeptidase [Peptostreptococcales bacterium]